MDPEKAELKAVIADLRRELADAKRELRRWVMANSRWAVFQANLCCDLERLHEKYKSMCKGD